MNNDMRFTIDLTITAKGPIRLTIIKPDGLTVSQTLLGHGTDSDVLKALDKAAETIEQCRQNMIEFGAF